MPQGSPIFELDDVRITPYVAQFGGTSYQITSISDVRATQAKRLSRLAIFVFLLGVGLFGGMLGDPRLGPTDMQPARGKLDL